MEELLDAGVSSFKIEGRLKDMAYVKNCTAYYRQELDKIFKRRPEYRTASTGHSSIEFTPQLEKSFNRGFTHYFLDGRTPEPIASPDTPKSLGEYVGKVKQSDKNTFTIAGLTSIHNGDGLCFANNKGEFEGVRVNRVEGNRIFPASRIEITPHTVLYRNFDFEFDKRLSRPSADRRIDVEITLYTVPGGYALYMKDECGNHTTIREDAPHETARTPQQETQKKQLGKLGTTAVPGPENRHRPARQFLHTGLRTFKAQAKSGRIPRPYQTHCLPNREATRGRQNRMLSPDRAILPRQRI